MNRHGLMVVALAATLAASPTLASSCKWPPRNAGATHERITWPYTWKRTPHGGEFARYYPATAAFQGDGRATITCELTAEGFLRNCVVDHEEPEGKGFGAATVKLALLFQLDMKASCARPGMRLQFPVAWRMNG